MRKILNRRFFNRPTLMVARDLLGKFLVRRIGKKETVLMIMEVETYDGLKDKASHAHRGKTKRNEVMFGEAGRWYVYFTYGMHWMLNIVTGKKDYPAAVLIRGAGGMTGPAKLTKLLKIGKSLNSKTSSKKSSLWIEDRGMKIKNSRVRKTGRVGVAYAGKYWASRRYRFVVE